MISRHILLLWPGTGMGFINKVEMWKFEVSAYTGYLISLHIQSVCICNCVVILFTGLLISFQASNLLQSENISTTDRGTVVTFPCLTTIMVTGGNRSFYCSKCQNVSVDWRRHTNLSLVDLLKQVLVSTVSSLVCSGHSCKGVHWIFGICIAASLRLCFV